MSKSAAQAKPASTSDVTRSHAGVLQTKAAFSRQMAGNHRGAASQVHDVVTSEGQPLDNFARSQAEAHLGYDFSRVRVHANESAAESARAVRAHAYTAGDHLVFGAGEYSPGTPPGRLLITHELAHVAQQASGPVNARNTEKGLAMSEPTDVEERAARLVAGSLSPTPRTALGAPRPLPQTTGHAESQGHVIQRADTDLSAGTSGAVAGASIAGGIGGLAGGIAGLVGLSAAFRSAEATERQADAAEFVAAGGFTFDSFAFPEITVTRSRSTDAGPAAGPARPQAAPDAGATAAAQPAADAASPPSVENVNDSEEKSIDLLHVQARDGDEAQIVLRMQTDGHNFLPGGVIEQGDTVGYGGGVRGSNGRVVITSVAPANNLGTGDSQIATASIRFRGENRRPGSAVQRFTGRVIVAADGRVLYAESSQSARESQLRGATSNDIGRQPAVIVALGRPSISDTGPSGQIPTRASRQAPAQGDGAGLPRPERRPPGEKGDFPGPEPPVRRGGTAVG